MQNQVGFCVDSPAGQFAFCLIILPLCRRPLRWGDLPGEGADKSQVQRPTRCPVLLKSAPAAPASQWLLRPPGRRLSLVSREKRRWLAGAVLPYSNQNNQTNAAIVGNNVCRSIVMKFTRRSFFNWWWFSVDGLDVPLSHNRRSSLLNTSLQKRSL